MNNELNKLSNKKLENLLQEMGSDVQKQNIRPEFSQNLSNQLKAEFTAVKTGLVSQFIEKITHSIMGPVAGIGTMAVVAMIVIFNVNHNPAMIDESNYNEDQSLTQDVKEDSVLDSIQTTKEQSTSKSSKPKQNETTASNIFNNSSQKNLPTTAPTVPTNNVIVPNGGASIELEAEPAMDDEDLTEEEKKKLEEEKMLENDT